MHHGTCLLPCRCVLPSQDSPNPCILLLHPNKGYVLGHGEKDEETDSGKHIWLRLPWVGISVELDGGEEHNKKIDCVVQAVGSS